MIKYSNAQKWLSISLTLIVMCASSNLFGAQVAYAQPTPPTKVWLPVVMKNYPWASPFGVHINIGNVTNPTLKTRVTQLGAKWLRIGLLSWRAVQPTQNSAYNWSAVATIENDLISASSLGLRTMLIVGDTPNWATINTPFATTCGAIRTDRFGDFAAFMTALVNRYKVAPYNVHDWEMGNEIDIDPTDVAVDQGFGCWGKKSDTEYFGGQQYGNMLKAVTPAIRAADPAAVVALGGLLLASPNSVDTPTQIKGKPERFLAGVLQAGAANFFDVLPFHSYPTYTDEMKDYDRVSDPWPALGGWTQGKVTYLRNLMKQFGVNKTLWMNETSFICRPPRFDLPCTPPDANFFIAQADHLIHSFARGLALGVTNITWYTLEDSGWRYSGLMDSNQNPVPSFIAYQTMISHTTNSVLPPPAVSVYGAAVEAYRFQRDLVAVDLVWSLDQTTDTVTLPTASFIAAYNAATGAPVSGTVSGSTVQLPASFSGLYIHRTP